MEFTELKDYQGIMTALRNSFDSLSWNFLFRSLESFGFGVSFIKWVKTFYNNITSCVANNGFFTPTFRVKRGVRQGDPLAPSLFIMVLEFLFFFFLIFFNFILLTTLLLLNSILHYLHYTLHYLHYTLHYLHYTLHYLHYILHYLHYTLHYLHYTLHYFTLLTLHFNNT